VRAAYEEKKQAIGVPVLEHFEKAAMLQILDTLWREHLAAMDYLRLGIHLRGYAQRDPKQEYKREAFGMFNDMLARYKHDVISLLARVRIQTEAEVRELEEQRRRPREMHFQHDAAPGAAPDAAEAAPPPESATAAAGAAPRRLEQAPPPMRPATVTREAPKVGRNDPCPCGSGKKYKQCHGALV
jgi:preprotein translocase subunit SecA